MIKIEYRNDLQGFEKYGSCASCGKEKDVFRLSFEDLFSNCSYINLCADCMIELRNMIDDYKRE